MQLTKNQKIAIGVGAIIVVGAFTIRIFRCGMRTDLTLWQFIVNHTIYGPPVEYVPSEMYTEELCNG